MAQLQHVVNLDEAECTMDKIAKDWDKFLYDNSSNGGVIDALDRVYDMIKQLDTDIQTVKGNVQKIINMYDICPVEEQLNRYCQSVEHFKENLSRFSSDLNGKMVESVTKLMEKDASFSEDLAMLNDLVANNDLSQEFESSATTGRVA